MKKLKVLALALICAVFSPAKADEGMWLLQLMQEQNLADRMKAQGLKIEVDDIYSPNRVALKDAVGIFGRGCTGEIISPDGLILTNHHCGYDAIQQHSSVEHDYLTDGFWAKNRSEELPTPGLTFKFVERIVDVTDQVNQDIKDGKVTELNSFGSEYLKKLADEALKKSDLKGKPGISTQALPFYEGNKFYLFFIKTYSDVRMVAAPPSSIGKFGGETDNWMWPRHTGDFSMFRIYADKNGDPAPYSAENVPLKVKKHLAISLKGLQEGDYAMIMGFPGSTSRYLTQSEVKLRMDGTNTPRIQVREARQDVLRKEMAASDKVRIQYASKFASSSNYWKNSIGMNKAIVDNRVLETKAEQEANFAKFAKEKNNADYASVVAKIDEYVTRVTPLAKQLTYFTETFRSGIEFGATYLIFDNLKVALEKNKKKDIEKALEQLKEGYANVHNKDYDHEVDRKVAKVLIPLYAKSVPADALPAFYETIKTKYNGDYNAYIDALYDTSIFSNQKNFDAFLANPTLEAINNDLAVQYSTSKNEMLQKLYEDYDKACGDIDLLHKTYVRGLCEMYAPTPKAPDANFTIRLTYGNVKSYDPKDGVHYKYYTTLKGVMEKEDPNNPEFVVPAKLKELYATKNYGHYALPNGEMPTCFLTTNDITGGNSGSPVMNGNGELIGAAFDGNWESLSGDINFDNNLQRCIAVDIRYVLFIVEKLGGCKNLIDEMTIVE
ncbi:S46 family peptidase [Phocaeicola salanitronis]|uniref:S46 family peptidase n=1 Tax=Phocaeicola salanitronis TaxID=376805 RepID=UPI0025A3BB54|nr:S46 family peptidase [Phocaeicola salanitronis]MDM8305084.1 S46 family peptidase [Phocaeicola salanitronis]